MSQIPQRKHSKKELGKIKARSAMQMPGQSTVNPYDKQLASRVLVIFGYLCAISAVIYLMFLKFQDKLHHDMQDLNIMLIGAIVAFAIATYIFFFRSLSRHHASFIVIITLLSSFSMVYLVKSDASLKRIVKGKLGMKVPVEQSEADKILNNVLTNADNADNAKDRTTSAGTSQPARNFSAEELKIREEARKAFAEIEERNARAIEAAKKKEELEKEEPAEKNP